MSAEQMGGTVDHLDRRERRGGLLLDGRAVGVDHHLADPLHGEQRRHDAVEQRDAVERAVILARHPLAAVAHRDEGDDVEAHRPAREDRSRPVNPLG